MDSLVNEVEKVKDFSRKNGFKEARALMHTSKKLFQNLEDWMSMVIITEALYYGDMNFPKCGIYWYSVLHLYPSVLDTEANTHCMDIIQCLALLETQKFPGAIDAFKLVKEWKYVLCDQESRLEFDRKREESWLIDQAPSLGKSVSTTFIEGYLAWKPPIFSSDVADYVHSHKRARIYVPICSSEVEGERLEKKVKHQVFHELPLQQPHYRPLARYCGKVREGMMIGLDVAFINLAEEIRRVEDPKSFWAKRDGFIKQLRVLEEMGYNVEKLRKHLKVLKKEAERNQELEKEEDELEAEREQALDVISNSQEQILCFEKEINDSKIVLENYDAKLITVKKARTDADNACIISKEWCVEVKLGLML